MARKANILKQVDYEAAFRGAFKGGAKRVEIEVSLDRKTLKVTGHADDPTLTQEDDTPDRVSELIRDAN